MFRITCRVAAIALIAGGLSIQKAGAQTPAPGLSPNADLTATLDAGPDATAFGTESGGIFVQFDQQVFADDNKLFNDPRPSEGGWKGLANLLEALTPNVDTEIPLTASEITSRISAMLDRGEYQEALNVIERRTQQYESTNNLGTDVQLMFLHGRALAALDRQDEAIALYSTMTTKYPELPEPWNNLAAEYVKQGKLEMARDALTMALAANPNYGVAKANMGEVQLMLARASFQDAARMGVGGSQSKAAATADILKK